MFARNVLLYASAAFISAIACFAAEAQTQIGELYFRGEAGWSGATNPNIHDRNFPVDHTIVGPGGVPGSLNDIGSGWFAGGGFGTQFIPNFRADLTYTYRGGYRLDEFDQAPSPSRFTADIFAHSVMASGYADFPYVYDGIVPFLGAGIGWSQINLTNLAAISSGTTVAAPKGISDNFSWQVMAGVGFAISNGIVADIFYRYFDGGHMHSRAGNTTISGNIVGTYQGAEGALHAHEFGISFRAPIR